MGKTSGWPPIEPICPKTLRMEWTPRGTSPPFGHPGWPLIGTEIRRLGLRFPSYKRISLRTHYNTPF